MPVVEGALVLDLFAGTGALGIEALSRGASHATFVDDAAPAIEAVTANLERTLRDEYVPLLRAIFDCRVPTIAAVNGPAAGAGARCKGRGLSPVV